MPGARHVKPEANMRPLLAIAIIAGGVIALTAPADAARRYKSNSYPGTDSACEMRALHADRTGVYKSYPCWAREAFGQGTLGGGRGRR
jgi:hypothetical protein